MIPDQDFEDRLAAWFEDGPTSAPDAPIAVAVEHARSHPRRVRWWDPAGWLAPAPVVPVSTPTLQIRLRFRLAWALVIVGVVLALIAAALIGSRQSLVVDLPANGLLAFSYDGDIWTVHEGGAGTDLTQGSADIETAPAWSPDGRRLAFRSATMTEPRRFRIDLLDLATGARRTVSGDAQASQGRLAFSPDGRYLAFGQGTGALPSLTIVSVQGSAPARVVEGLVGTSPAFSPDGTRIAFVGRRADAARTDLYLVDVATLQATRLTTYEQLGRGWISSPSWAEGGRSIVFEAAVVDASGTLSRHIYVIGADGGGLRHLGPSAGWQEANDFATGPVVSPRGDRVAFQGDGTLKVLDIRTGALTGPSTPADRRLGAGGIAWAPDGAALAVLDWRACPGAASYAQICPAGIDIVASGTVGQPETPWTPSVTDSPASEPPFTWDLAWQPLPRSTGRTP